MNYILKYQEQLYFEYHKDLFVKDIPFIVFHQLKGFGSKIDMSIVKRIINNKQYLILLLSSFGLVVRILDDIEENIYHLLKPNINYIKCELIIKHVCIYYIKYLNKIKFIYNIITINIVTSENMNKIFNNKYDNEEFINAPIILLNYKIQYYKKFLKLMKKTFRKNMRINDSKDYTLEFYCIADTDILDVNISQLRIIKVDYNNFFLYVMTLDREFKSMDYKRFIISYQLKN